MKTIKLRRVKQLARDIDDTVIEPGLLDSRTQRAHSPHYTDSHNLVTWLWQGFKYMRSDK